MQITCPICKDTLSYMSFRVEKVIQSGSKCFSYRSDDIGKII